MQEPNRTQNKFYAKYGPWAVVTGASAGIGREIAICLAEYGLNLVLVARSRNVLQELADDLTKRHRVEARIVAVDLAQETGIEAISTTVGDLEVGMVVASAGFGTTGLFIDAQLEQELEMLNVNCRSLLAISWYFGQRFAQRGRGGIVLMSSIVGFHGVPNSAHYAATKAYVQSLAEALHVELAANGVDVLASAPGPTQSGFAARAGMQMGMALSAATVARATLAALGRRSTVLPGFLSKLLVYSLVPLPRWARIRIMGSVMGGMLKQKAEALVVKTKG